MLKRLRIRTPRRKGHGGGHRHVLTTRSLARAFQTRQRLTGSIRFDEGRFPVVVTVDLTNEWNCFVELIHPTRDEREGDRIVTDRIQLTWTTPTYGGRRWWFLCPRTAYRTTKLFLPNGGWHFWCRQAYGLGYAMPASAKDVLIAFSDGPQC